MSEDRCYKVYQKVPNFIAQQNQTQNEATSVARKKSLATVPYFKLPAMSNLYDSIYTTGSSFDFTDKDGAIHKIPYLDQSTATGLMKDCVEELKQYEDNFGYKALLLKNGSVLLDISGIYALYPSVTILEQATSTTSERSGKPIFYKRNPYKELFVENIPGIKAGFFLETSIDSSLSGMQLLAAIDHFLESNRTTEIVERCFLSFHAFVGEVVVQTGKANWQMSHDADSDTWVPFLASDKHKVFFDGYLLDDLYNKNQKQPLREVYETIIAILNQ